MKSEFTFEEVRNLFIKIENKYEVYTLEKGGVFFWKLIRFELFDNIIRSLGLINEGHPLGFSDKIKRLGLLLLYSIKNIGRKKYIQKSDILLLTHGRKQYYNGKYVDIYLHDVMQSNLNSGKSTFVIDRPDHYGKHYDANYSNMIYFERFAHILREIFYEFPLRNNKDKDETSIIKKINQDLNDTFCIKIDLVDLICKRVFRFNLEKKYFDNILDKVKPKKIYLVVSYGKEELISSARERGIKVAELQHGVISKYHMGYYFPFDFSIPYFPNELILFGEYWKDSVEFPRGTNLVVQHFSLLSKKEECDFNAHKSDAILFISQASIGDKLSRVATSFANNNEVECYYKLHPSEFGNWKSKYPELAESADKERIVVIKNEKSIYELFGICNYVVGVYSTAIYESLMHGCKTFLVNIEGYQYMDYLIQNGYVRLLTDKFSFNDLKDFSNKGISNKSYFYL